MADFFDGHEGWKSNLRRTTLVKEGVNVSSLIDGHHIQQSFNTDKPVLVSSNYTQIFSSADRYAGKVLLGMTEASGRAKEIHQNRYRWTLSGGNDEYPKVMRKVCTDSRPGLNKTTWDIVVDRPYWNISDIVIPEDSDYRCLVTVPDGSNSRAQRPEHGGGYRYTLQLLNDDASAFLPPVFLEGGQEWNQVSSAVADESNFDGGGFHFYSVWESRGQVQQHAKKYSLTDRAARRIKQAKENGASTCDVFGEGVKNSDYAALTSALWIRDESTGQTKPTWNWINAFDAELMNTLHNDVENTLMFGKESSNNYSPEGFQILTASGLREQLLSGHTFQHNGFMDLSELENWFDSIMKHRITEENRNIVLSCGYEFRKTAVFCRYLLAA